MDMSINKKIPISQLEPFEKPCFVHFGLIDFDKFIVGLNWNFVFKVVLSLT
jgi:hypothetical protein